MFTGIIEDDGRVLERAPRDQGARIVVETALHLAETSLGDSIAVNGCCLTVVALERSGDRWTVAFDLGPETLKVTTLGGLDVGGRVHLERALRLSDRLGGHMVAGHVDAVGVVEQRRPMGDALFLRIAAPPAITRYCIHKGSVAVDGVSLTLNAVDDGGFEVGLIPHTLEMTHLGALAEGSRVNLEADLIGKYVERLLPR